RESDQALASRRNSNFRLGHAQSCCRCALAKTGIGILMVAALSASADCTPQVEHGDPSTNEVLCQSRKSFGPIVRPNGTRLVGFHLPRSLRLSSPGGDHASALRSLPVIGD